MSMSKWGIYRRSREQTPHADVLVERLFRVVVGEREAMAQADMLGGDVTVREIGLATRQEEDDASVRTTSKPEQR